MAARHHPDLVMCRKLPGIGILHQRLPWSNTGHVSCGKAVRQVRRPLRPLRLVRPSHRNRPCL